MEHQSASLAFQTGFHYVSNSYIGLNSKTNTSRPRFHTQFISRSKSNTHVLLSYTTISKRSTVKCSADISTWSALSTKEFDQKLQNQQLPLCFVGMSNCGKSHWSNQLSSERDFHLICVDDDIELQIKPELAQLGYSGIDGMAEWMGFPSDERFENNQARYLSYEEKITFNANPKLGNNTVLDTTGSVVYLSKQTLNKLQNNYLIIHFEATDDMLDYMTTNYFKTPKPVVWGDAYNRRENEGVNEALRRCYPNLLRERRLRYAQLAHVTIPTTISLSREIDLDEMLQNIRSKLK